MTLMMELKEQRREGRDEGVESARKESALAMFADHLPVEKVAKYSMLSLQDAIDLGRKHGYIQQ